MLLVLEREEFDIRLCPLQQRRESTQQRDKEVQVSQWELKRPVCGRAYMRQYASNYRKEKTGYEK